MRSVACRCPRGILALGALALLLSGACGDRGAAGSGEPVATVPPTPSSTTAPTASPTTAAPAVVTAALEQAAADAGVPNQSVALIDFRYMEWSNAALGCPQPGKFYAQVITPGYIVLIDVAGQQREYHTDLDSRVVSCDEVSGG